MTKPPPVILVGAQRSGTTALAFVLHSAFAAAGGTFTVNGKLPYLLHRWCTTGDLEGRHLRADEIIYALRRRPPLTPLGDQWLHQVESILRATAAEVARGDWDDEVALRRHIVRCSYEPSTRYGDKYNEYLLELNNLLTTVPDAHVVLMVRHPADVAASMLRWTGDRPWLPRDVPALLDKWVAWHRPFLASALSGNRRRCTIVEYHSLCRGADLRRLSQALNLDLTPYGEALSVREPRANRSLPGPVRQIYEQLMDLR